jgi:LytS/YehU family sensor histidine kinase
LSNANKYLSIFASLIRETLENSTLGYITIRREVEYLSKYLELEQLRFGMRFSYSIKTGNILNDNNVKIPVMLLQPFVENAVRHGMRYKLDGSGNIEISFHLLDNQLHCYVEDNGPGREKTAALRTYQHIEYQSRGMELTQKRIELLNKIYADKISIFVNDRHDENGNTNGTSVHIVIEQNYE